MQKGSKSVIVSCLTGREKQSAREAMNILSEALEELRGDVQDDNVTDTEAEEKDATDISALLAQEISDLKDKKKQDFTIREMGIPSMVCIECAYKTGPKPSELVMHALENAKKTQQNKARFCKRFYPIDYTSSSTMEDIKAMAERIAKEHFPQKIADGKTVLFSVDCERRCAPPDMERIDVIMAYAAAIPQPPYKVDLNAPELTVLVNVIKGTCGASVVRNYRAMNKYNLHELVAVTSDACEKTAPDEGRDLKKQDLKESE